MLANPSVIHLLSVRFWCPYRIWENQCSGEVCTSKSPYHELLQFVQSPFRWWDLTGKKTRTSLIAVLLGIYRDLSPARFWFIRGATGTINIVAHAELFISTTMKDWLSMHFIHKHNKSLSQHELYRLQRDHIDIDRGICQALASVSSEVRLPVNQSDSSQANRPNFM